MRTTMALFILFGIFGVTASAFAQDSERGTVNKYTSTQASTAKRLVTQEGYQPNEITMAQAGNLFLTAQRGGNVYTLVVTPDNQLYASTPLLARTNTMSTNALALGSDAGGMSSPR